MGDARQPALQMIAVGKKYPGTVAVDAVDFDVYPGEVHALVGENGAGKSTLMKMLAGSFDDYTGRIVVNGVDVALHSPAIAMRHGIGMIYQEQSLARPISIAENLLAGALPRKGIFVDRAAVLDRSRELLSYVGIDLDPTLPIEDISQHEAQLVEIAKVLGAGPSILVMDEPTSALSREEVQRLFTIIEGLKERRLAIVYISHHLPEIFQIADRVTVMRDGKKVGERPRSQMTREEIVQMMVGRSVKDLANTQPRTVGAPRLVVEALSRFGFFHDVSFTAHAGEIVAVCGLSGAGRSELARVVCGLDAADAGRVQVDGHDVLALSMDKRVAMGLGYLTEDRKTEGLALRLPVDDNALAAVIRRLTKGLVFQKALGAKRVRELIEELAIYPPDPRRTVGNLSGGNQQKVLLAKWLAINPTVLILDEPTRGVDIGAKMIIHAAIERLAAAGSAVVLISSDLPELVRLSDRVLIMRRGHFTGEMDGNTCTEEGLLLAANAEVAQ